MQPAKAMLKAIPNVTYEGICTTYKSDSLQVLSHTADIVKFDASGKPSIAKHMTFAPGCVALHGGDHHRGPADHHDGSAGLIGGRKHFEAPCEPAR